MKPITGGGWAGCKILKYFKQDSVQNANVASDLVSCKDVPAHNLKLEDAI